MIVTDVPPDVSPASGLTPVTTGGLDPTITRESPTPSPPPPTLWTGPGSVTSAGIGLLASKLVALPSWPQ